MVNKKHPNFQDLYNFDDISKAMFCSKRTGYYPISLIPKDQEEILDNTGRLGTYELNNTSQRTYTLKYWYAIQVWNTAIAIASNHVVSNDLLHILPHWEDRDDSFRKLVDDEKFTPDLVTKLWRLLEDVANSGNIKVHEGFFIDNVTKGYWGDFSYSHIEMECKFNINIILDMPSARTRTFPIENIWEYEFCKEEKDYGWDEIKHLFCEVSLAVREIMNHRWMNKKGDLDKELFKACRNLDLAGVKNAIEKGANVNAIDDCGETALNDAVDLYSCVGMLNDVNYTEDEEKEIEENNYCKLIAIIDFLIEHGADINLFGYEGNSPIVSAYHTHSPRLVEYLLKKGANPNVNCYLTDKMEEIYCSTILSCIFEDLPEEYDEAEREIERLVKQYGGRLYYWGYNPVKREYVDRAFVGFWPTENTLFEDSAYDGCGDYKTLHIEISENNFVDIDISSVKGLQDWHQEFIMNYYDDKSVRTDEVWNAWFDRGLELARCVKALLPNNVDLYYLYDSRPVFRTRKDGSKYWNQSGERILVE